MRKAVVFALSLIACNGAPASGTATPDTPSVPTQPMPADTDSDAAPGSSADAKTPATSEGRARALARDQNALAFELHRAMTGDSVDNLVFSPASITAAFAMTYAGARGSTAEQMARALHYRLPAPTLHETLGAMLQSWQTSAEDTYRLQLANRVWRRDDIEVEPGFAELVQTHYGAPIERADFTQAPDQARNEINAWVADRTQDKIRDLLPAGSIDASTALVLVNAIYFKGLWSKPFTTDRTTDAPFTTLGGDKTSVPMMMQRETFAFAEVGDTKLLQLPYEGGRLAMTVVLPKTADGLTALEQSLDPETLHQWLQKMQPQEVDVRLPRFQLAPPTGISLRDTLGAMGMRDAFTPAADFSGMAAVKPLFIDDAFHKAFIEVNEEGTEAAAATGVVMTTRAAPRTVRFFADRPFLFMIRELQTGTILFLGRVTDPSKGDA